MENYSDNNSILIGGVVVSEPEFSHEVFEEKFYSFNLETKRLSDYNDVLPVIISERLIDIKSIKNGLLVKIKGQFRSYNKLVDNKSKLVLSIFAKEIEVVEDESVITLNEANFIGYICKNPIYRKLHLVERLQMFWLQLIDHIKNLTISHVFYGEEMQNFVRH